MLAHAGCLAAGGGTGCGTVSDPDPERSQTALVCQYSDFVVLGLSNKWQPCMSAAMTKRKKNKKTKKIFFQSPRLRGCQRWPELTRWGLPASLDFRVSAGELLLERGECDFSTFPSD